VCWLYRCVACDIQLWRLSSVFHVSSLGSYVSFHWYPSSQTVNSFALFFFFFFHFVHCDIIFTKLVQQNAHTLRQAYVSGLYFGWRNMNVKYQPIHWVTFCVFILEQVCYDDNAIKCTPVQRVLVMGLC
jgi:hypothetical protein